MRRASLIVKVAIKKYGAIVEPQTRKGHYIASRFRMATTGEGEAVLGWVRGGPNVYIEPRFAEDQSYLSICSGSFRGSAYDLC